MANIEKLQHLLARGTGHKNMDDVIFKKIDDSLRIYNRVGLFDIFDKSQKECYMYKQFLFKNILNFDITKLIFRSDTSDTFLCNVDGCSSTFTSMADYDLHYNSNHRYTCTYCRKLLQSAHLLDLHISELHDNFFKASSAKKPMVLFKVLILNYNILILYKITV